MTGAAGMNKGNPDNLHAMMEAAKEYGVYNSKRIVIASNLVTIAIPSL